MTQIDIAGFSIPMVGFAASLPWDRSERTVQFAGVVHQDHRQSHHQVRRRRAQQPRLPAADAGQRRTARAVPVPRAADGDSHRRGGAERFRQRVCLVPARRARGRRPRPQGGEPGHASLGVLHVHPGQVAGVAESDDRYRAAPRVLHAARRASTSSGSLSNYDPATNTLHVDGLQRACPTRWASRSTSKNFSPRGGLSYRFDEQSVLRAGYGVSTMPFPDNTYAFNFPVKQLNQFHPPNTFAAAGSMRAGFPAPVVADIPANGIIDAGTPALRTQGVLLRAAGSARGLAAFMERRLPTRARRPMDGGSGLRRQPRPRHHRHHNMNAGMVLGADNAGRPLFSTVRPHGRRDHVGAR